MPSRFLCGDRAGSYGKLKHFERVSAMCCEIPQCGSGELQQWDLLCLASEKTVLLGGLVRLEEVGGLESVDYGVY